MKAHFFSLCWTLLFAIGCQTVSAQSTELDAVRGLNSYLQKNGVIVFAQAVSENHWRTPTISSRWYVERVVVSGDAPLEREKRDFGKALEARISELVPQLHASRDVTETYRRSALLIQLADWLSVSEGYGNLVLAARCKDVATVGLGPLVANLDFPMEKLAGLLTSLAPPTSSLRARVLNQEAGVELFSTTTTQDELESVWRSGALLMLEQANPKLRETRLSHPEVKVVETPSIKRSLPFFVDDDLPMPPTTANLWSRKNHERLVTGLDVPNARKLLALAAFRQAVKAFPTKPTYRPHDFESDGKAAFDEAWRPHATPETHALFALAWLTFDLIQRGQFLDQDTTVSAN